MTTERADVRKMVSDIRSSLSGHSREQLEEILVHLYLTYVIEGVSPMAVPQVERIAELEGLTFPQLIETLQLRLDLAELALFHIEGGRVSLRSGGRQIPVEAERARDLPDPSQGVSQTNQAAQTAAVASPGMTSEEFVTRAPTLGNADALTSDEQRRAEEQRIESARRSAQPAAAPPAPRPTRGVSVSGGALPTPAGGARPASAPAGGARPAAAAAQPEKKSGFDPEGDSMERFRLLELD